MRANLKRNIRRILFVFGGLVRLLLVAALVVILFFGQTSPLQLPNPNGYDDLTKAGQAVRGNLALAERNLDDVRALVASARS